MNYSVLLSPRKFYAAIKRRVVQRRTIIQAIKNGKRRFASDPNFRPDLVPGYFVPRLVDYQDDLEILKQSSPHIRRRRSHREALTLHSMSATSGSQFMSGI